LYDVDFVKLRSEEEFWYCGGSQDSAHRAGQRVAKFLIVGVLSMGGCQVVTRKASPWTIVGNVCGQCHTICMLKFSFVDFEKEEEHCSHYYRLHLSLANFVHLTNDSLKWFALLCHPSIVYLVHVAIPPSFI
jgi:hypothetical protein